MWVRYSDRYFACLFSITPLRHFPVLLVLCSGGCRQTVRVIFLRLFLRKGAGSGVWWRDQNTFSRHSGGPALGARDRFVGRSNKGRPPRPHPPKKPCADLFELRSQCRTERWWMIRESSCRYFPLPCGVSAYTQLSRRRKRLGFRIYQMSGPRVRL